MAIVRPAGNKGRDRYRQQGSPQPLRSVWESSARGKPGASYKRTRSSSPRAPLSKSSGEPVGRLLDKSRVR